MSASMRLLDLPQFAAFREQRDVKVLRHKDTGFDIWRLRPCLAPVVVQRANGSETYHCFEDYQDGQSWDVFGKAKVVVSFVAERHKYAKFVGVWRVLAKTRKAKGGYQYTTKEVLGFESLEKRLVVQWGLGTRSWAQWLHRQGNKEISEILPVGYVADFPGFYDIVLSHDQLATMISKPDANREWQRMLSSISGVYLIVDQETGKQYVGSAYGLGGIWKRWSDYAKNPTGGNLLLRELLGEHPGRHLRFQFSILRVLEPGIQRDAVLKQEALVKQKLGSKATGLNAN